LIPCFEITADGKTAIEIAEEKNFGEALKVLKPSVEIGGE